jgi:hypothetical protein
MDIFPNKDENPVGKVELNKPFAKTYAETLIES